MSNVETIKVVPARYPLRAAGAVVALFVLAVVIQSVALIRAGSGRYLPAGSSTR